MTNEKKSRKTNVPQHAIANHQIDYHGACNRTTNKGFRAGQWYRRYRTIICSTLSIFNRGPQIYLRMPATLATLHNRTKRRDRFLFVLFSPFSFFSFHFSLFLLFLKLYFSRNVENRAKGIRITQMDKDERTGYQMTTEDKKCT